MAVPKSGTIVRKRVVSAEAQTPTNEAQTTVLHQTLKPNYAD